MSYCHLFRRFAGIEIRRQELPARYTGICSYILICITTYTLNNNNNNNVHSTYICEYLAEDGISTPAPLGIFIFMGTT